MKCQVQLGFVITYDDTVTSRNSFLHCTPRYVRANSSLIMENMTDAPVTPLLPKQLKTLQSVPGHGLDYDFSAQLCTLMLPFLGKKRHAFQSSFVYVRQLKCICKC